MAIVLTPVIYIAEKKISDYVGHDVAEKMKKDAMGQPDMGLDNIPTAG